MYYDKTITKSRNKYKATWDIIKKLSNNQQPQTDIQELIIDTKHLKDQQDTANTFNNYFSTIIDKISTNNINNKNDKENFPTFQHYLEQNHSCIYSFGYFPGVRFLFADVSEPSISSIF